MTDTVGGRVKQARMALGLSQTELANPDFHKSFICLVEQSKSRPSPRSLERLAQRLQKPLAYFLAGSTDPELARRVLEILRCRGRSALETNKYDVALGTCSQMAELAAVCGDRTMEMHAALGLGEALVGLWRGDEAKPHLERALADAIGAENRLVECRSLAGLGRVAHRRGQFPEAAERYDGALAIVSNLTPPEPLLHGVILLRRGMVLLHMGRLEEAAEGFAHGQRIFEDAGRQDRVGEAQVDYSFLWYLKGEYDKALLCLERACVLPC